LVADVASVLLVDRVERIVRAGPGVRRLRVVVVRALEERIDRLGRAVVVNRDLLLVLGGEPVEEDLIDRADGRLRERLAGHQAAVFEAPIAARTAQDDRAALRARAIGSGKAVALGPTTGQRRAGGRAHDDQLSPRAETWRIRGPARAIAARSGSVM